MKKGFTLLEVIIASVILGLGLGAILFSVSTSQKMILGSTYYETVQEVMDLGEMAYPLAEVKEVDDIDVGETKATELWELVSKERLTSAQEDKFYGYTWERECINKHDDEDVKRLGGLYRVKITVRWGDRYRGHGESESYFTFWRKKE
ncbi:MAG: prepilin-type N-terminal cleavage/methylation domain-containing protein [Kiritimatiellae bacterium]|nr:prepilin-type N-terminal cleavage/methylation domain-containing protein [Kiritimatiellia bacterium]